MSGSGSGSQTQAESAVYCTVNQVKEHLGLVGVEDYDGLLAWNISVASRVIDRKCRRSFVVGTEDETRLFGKCGKKRLRIDDLRQMTKIEIDTDDDGNFDLELSSTSYYLEPDNTLPKTTLVLREGNKELAAFPKYPQSIRITALWGYGAEIPEQIQQACIMIVSYLFKRKDAAYADVTGSPDLESMRLPQGLSADITLLLTGFIRPKEVLIS
ncbi:MAG: hypothetical protein SVY53_05970 [Chloroflexota bacterium]|nr:hypothetical protein [Chloroflexota bacterium]